MEAQTPKQSLILLSRALLTIHRSLLHDQKEVYEEEHNKKLTPHEFLDLSMTKLEFQWLKVLSGLIVTIDEAVDSKEPMDLSGLHTQSVAKLRALFLDQTQEKEFKSRIIQALQRNSHIWMEIAELRKQLA
jgi:hypothetical protein